MAFHSWISEVGKYNYEVLSLNPIQTYRLYPTHIQIISLISDKKQFSEVTDNKVLGYFIPLNGVCNWACVWLRIVQVHNMLHTHLF